MEERKIRVVITHGDTNSTGYEEVFKVFAEPAMLELCTPVIYGSPKIAAYHRKALDTQASFTIVGSAEEAHEGKVNMLAAFDEEVKVDLGQPTPESASAALKALDRAVEDYDKGVYDVLVTSPVSGTTFKGHTQYLSGKMGVESGVATLFVCERMRVGFVTAGMGLAEAVRSITKDSIVERARVINGSMKRDFRISNPRIAVLALDPVAAEKPKSDAAEQDVVAQAVAELKAEGIPAFGPYAADDFFAKGDEQHFDAVLAMYYDQGAIPFKLIAGDEAVAYTVGLPVVRTAPGHEAIFSTAGQNTTDESQLRQAIYLAIDIYRNRTEYDSPMGNPLPKLYREKRDDSEKVRFSIPKKKEQKA